MFTLFVRAVLVYTIVLIVFRLMGKRQLGQMQPFELVLTLIIADLATIPMAESSVPILHGVIPLLTLAKQHGIDLPICSSVYEVLYNNCDPKVALLKLFSRDRKKEF